MTKNAWILIISIFVFLLVGCSSSPLQKYTVSYLDKSGTLISSYKTVGVLNYGERWISFKKEGDNEYSTIIITEGSFIVTPRKEGEE